MQIVEFSTSDLDQVRRLDDEWEQATEGKRTARRQILVSDRNNPGHSMALVFFDSYESATENSRLPETQDFARKLTALSDGEPVFHDLDVIEERS
ncbi:MAG: hypothetical protein ACYCVZ_11155 [Streptosporangiaceae bacterium]